MSSAENTRRIPMTEAQRDYLDSLPANDTLYAIVEAWDAAGPVKPRLTTEQRAQIEACPTPVYHETHRYCPSCPWTEEGESA